jgi:hypothetical protein
VLFLQFIFVPNISFTLLNNYKLFSLWHSYFKSFLSKPHLRHLGPYPATHSLKKGEGDKEGRIMQDADATTTHETAARNFFEVHQ